MSYIVIFGSARDNGTTRKAVDKVFQNQEHRFVDLRQLKISHYDYEYKNAGDGFLPLMEDAIRYDTIVLASPIYWYSVSAYMKIFLDRWGDLVTTRQDLGFKLKGKRLFVITSFSTSSPLGCAGFEEPIKQTCNYMKIEYGGCYYDFPNEKLPKTLGFTSLEDFRSKLFMQTSIPTTTDAENEQPYP